MTLAERLLKHAQALENQAMFLEQKQMPARGARITAKLLREAAAELKK